MATAAVIAVALFVVPAAASDFVQLPHDGPLPLPTEQQLQYQGGISALIHFGMATFFHDGDPGCTASNWNGCDKTNGSSCNSSQVSSFAPTNLNVSSWIESFQNLGATSAVLTAKHGCGFLGWQTNTTLPDGKPYEYHVPPNLNVLEQFVEATEAAGIGHGFYYSLTNNFYLNVAQHKARPRETALPGQVSVTQAEFEALALAQVTELWTQFGDLSEIWLDGGCGEICDQVGTLVKRTKANKAVAFNGGSVSDSPVRWCGTEQGDPKQGSGGAVWSTSACADGWCAQGSGAGSPPNTSAAEWMPSGVDVTLQKSDRWFFVPDQPLHALGELVEFYHNSVGRNGHLEIDFAIDRTGGVHPTHAAAYGEFGDWIRSCYGKPLAAGALERGATTVELTFSTMTAVDRVRMEEDQSAGQIIVDYMVEAKVGGEWTTFSTGTSIGASRIDVAGEPVAADALRFTVLSGFAVPTAGLKFSAFAPEPCKVGND